MPLPTWPPADTDRNRFLLRPQVVLYALIAVYFGVFALGTGGLLPWIIFTAFLAATVVVGVALLLMRAQRRAAAERAPDRDAAHPTS